MILLHGVISLLDATSYDKKRAHEEPGLSGRVLDSGLKGIGFEPHWRHCVVSLSKTLYPLLSTGSTQGMSQHDGKIVDWDVKLQTKSIKHKIYHAHKCEKGILA